MAYLCKSASFAERLQEAAHHIASRGVMHWHIKICSSNVMILADRAWFTQAQTDLQDFAIPDELYTCHVSQLFDTLATRIVDFVRDIERCAMMHLCLQKQH